MNAKKITLFVSALMLAFSCQQKEPGKGFISFEGLEETYLFDADNPAGRTFIVKSDSKWSVVMFEDSQWLNVTPLKGNAGETAVTVTPQSNNGAFRRATYFNIICDAARQTRKVTVIQGGAAPYCLLDRTSMCLDYKGDDCEGSGRLQLETNGDWSVTCDSWILPSQKYGSGGLNIITISAERNDTETERSGSIIFSSNGAQTTLYITQKIKPVEPFPSGPWFDFGGGDIIISTAAAVDNPSEFKVRHSGWKEKGWILSDNAEGAGVEFIQNPANKVFSEQPEFDFEENTDKTFTVKGLFTGDALLFHIPVKHIDAGNSLVVTASHNITGTGGLYYMIEYSLDGGAVWIPAQTGQNTVKSRNLQAESNFHYSKKGSSAIVAKCRMENDVDEKLVYVRMRSADATATANGDITEPGSSFNFKIGGSGPKGIVISVESDLPPVPVDEWYDFANGPVLIKTDDAKTAPSAFQDRQKNWPAKGMMMADNTDCVWAGFVQNPDNKSYSEQPGFSFETSDVSPSKCFTLKSVYTGDALVFHIPAKQLDAGKKLVLNASMNITGTAGLCYMIEYSLDAGASWERATTGKAVIQSKYLKADSNFYFSKKGTAVIKAVCPITGNLTEKEVRIRITSVDGSDTTNGQATSPSSSYHTKFGAPSVDAAGITIELAD